LLVDLWHAQAQTAPGAVVRVLQVDLNTRMVVLAMRLETAMRAGAAGTGFGEAAPEQGLEEVAVVFLARTTSAEAAARRLEPCVPVRRRLEILPSAPVGAQPIVGRAFLRVLEHLVGFADLLETLFGLRLLADVRMVFARQ